MLEELVQQLVVFDLVSVRTRKAVRLEEHCTAVRSDVVLETPGRPVRCPCNGRLFPPGPSLGTRKPPRRRSSHLEGSSRRV